MYLFHNDIAKYAYQAKVNNTSFVLAFLIPIINNEKWDRISNFVSVQMKNVAFIICWLVAILGCTKESCDEIVPAISLTSADRTTTNTIVKIQVRDCDGDFGLEATDTAGNNRYNAFVDIRPFLNGEWAKNTVNYIDSTIITKLDKDQQVIPIDTIYDTLNFYYRVPYVDNNSLSDVYDAEIELDVIASDFGYDTFRMEIKIRDQSFHESNTVVTDQMIVCSE